MRFHVTGEKFVFCGRAHSEAVQCGRAACNWQENLTTKDTKDTK
jgi:hypothetical protein